MKKVAAYALFAMFSEASLAARRWDEVDALVDEWLASKGEVEGVSEPRVFAFSDGRRGSFVQTTFEVGGRRVLDRTLVEPSNDAQVQTRVSVGINGAALAVYIEIQAAGGTYQVGPMRVDIRPPTIIRMLVGAYGDWQVGETPVSDRVFQFSGAQGGNELDQVIWDPTRNLPLVAVSSHDGEYLADDFPQKLAGDLAGVAIVATLDADAARTVTAKRGKEWSCFNGAVRLFWPNPSSGSAYRHPLWLRSVLLGQATAQDASARFRRQMRRQLLGLSAFAVAEPSDMIETRAMHLADMQREERRALVDASDWEGLANKYAEANDKLEADVKALNERVRALTDEVANLQYALQWQQSEPAELPPEPEVPPSTVEEAIRFAREKYASDLVFGDDVNRGVSGLAPTAGPPEKVLIYLGHLAAMASLRRAKGLGAAPVKWLQDRGADCTGESLTIRNSVSEQRKRTWHDGTGKRVFETHMKPTDGTHPDRCVRIYFDYDDQIGRAVVGWVGRHP